MKLSIFATGIKVVELLAPYRRGGKLGLFGGVGLGKTVLIWVGKSLVQWQQNKSERRHLFCI